LWTIVNAEFTDEDAYRAWAAEQITWGLFQVPERDLGVLGDVAGLDVVELGCGSAYLSGWLARQGARPVGVDLTPAQLATAARCQEAEGFAQERLVRPQRALHRVQWPGGGVEFHPSHGEWIRILDSNGFVVEALHELYAPADGQTHQYYDIATAQWAMQWPVEDLWAARLTR